MPDRDDDHNRTTQVFSVLEPRGGATIAPPIKAAGRLVCVVGYQAGQVYVLGHQPSIIGRAVEADICLESADVSRRHARIEWHRDRFVLRDLGSRNGISVNGVPVQSHELQVGDRIQIGTSSMLIYAHHDELEQRAMRLQKLESLAQLAGGMVHDFRNTLAIISGSADFAAEMLAKRSGEDPDLLQSLQDIRGACSATAELTQRLLYFSRRDPAAESSQFRLLALVEEVLGLVRRTFASTRQIKIAVEIDPRLEVCGQRGDLHHAVLNLCFNARDAMPDGGTVTIRGEPRQFDQADALSRHLPSAGRYVEISVSDTGVGIDERSSGRIFEPFFTTKAAGEGTGLGLSTVYRIATNHGGNVVVESKVGQGTTFRIFLPDAAP